MKSRVRNILSILFLGEIVILGGLCVDEIMMMTHKVQAQGRVPMTSERKGGVGPLHEDEKSAPRPRFEVVEHEYGEYGYSYRVIHDKETGQEIVCAQPSGYSATCWLTGRSW